MFDSKYLLLFLCSIVCAAGLSELGEVVFVNIVYRHGYRTPQTTYPNDPYINETFWPIGWGHLTNEGKMGQYQLGKWLRARYADLLPKEYIANDIYVQSTDVDRTLMSAYCNLAGLYEPNPSNNWNPNLRWQPVPVHTSPKAVDILAGKRSCPRYDALYKDAQNDPTIVEIQNNHQNILDAMTNATGMDINNLDDVFDVYSTLRAEEINNLQLPPWTKHLYPEPMKELSDYSFLLQSFTPEMARLKIGPVIGQMVEDMQNKVASNSTRKVHMYSGHDYTVANVLKGINVFNTKCPPYYSTVLVELRKKDGDHFVTIFYRNSTKSPPHLLTIPGCSQLCSFENFKTLVQPVIPENWEKECETS